MEAGLEMLEGVRGALVGEALGARPAECCGVVAGRDGRAEAIYPVANAAADPTSRYEMDPSRLWSARRQAARAGLEVIGFYHSHPRTSAVPSAYDVSRAYYPDAVYVIVGIEPEPCVAAFWIAAGRFGEIPIRVVADRAE